MENHICSIEPQVYLCWFHVEYFGDAALHDEEVGIVDIELHRAEHVLDTRVVGVAAIDQVLVASTNNNLCTSFKSHLFGKQGMCTCK